MSRKINERGNSPYRALSIVVALSLAPISPPARAGTVLFDSLGSAINIDVAVSANYWDAVSFQTDANSYQLTNVTVSLERASGATGTMTVLLLGNAPSVNPAATLMTLGTVNDTSISASSFQLFSFSGNNFALAPNTVYWIAMEGTGTTIGDGGWQFNDVESGILASQQSDAYASPPPTWNVTTIQQAFNNFVPAMEVDAQVAGASAAPEPSTLWLVASVALGIIARRSVKSAAALAILAAILPAHAGTVMYSSLAGASMTGAADVSDTWEAESLQTDNHSYQLTNVTVNLAQSTATTGTVSVFLFSYALGNVPGSQLASLGSVNDSSLPDPSALGFLPFSFNGNNFALAPNTSYYIVLEGSSTGGLVDALWEDAFGFTGINAIGQYGATTSSSPNNWTSAPVNNPVGINFAMEVDAQMVTGGTSAPEPSTLWLIAGVALAVFSRRALR